MRIFLSGPMGSGKSTVARELAARLAVPYVDLDAEIAASTGKPIATLFASRGEPAFREQERAELARVLEAHGDAVVALGGGTVVDRATRHRLLSNGVLVTLVADAGTLAGRVSAAHDRPLLAGRDARTALRDIIESRADAYAECHATVRTDGLAPADVAAEVERVAHEAGVVVPLGARTYRVEIGRGVRRRIAARASAPSGARVVAVVTDANIAEPWAAECAQSLRDAGHDVVEIVLPPGEQHKTLASVERVWDAALDRRIDRRGLVVAVGGGVVGDVAGLAASTLLRGVAIGQVPTSLLAMVDSAVGGKTGIDRARGKNLVGTFHQPAFVLCDVDTLETLPAVERRAAMAEVVKAAWISGEDAVASLEGDAAALARGDLDATERAIRMAVALKARIVSGDERESGSGERTKLNLGHTLGHAIEAAHGFTGVRHGEAVALGMAAAFRVSMRLSVASTAHAERALALLGAFGLDTDVEPHLGAETLALVGADKKRTSGKVRFVVPGAPGDVRLVELETDRLAGLLRS